MCKCRNGVIFIIKCSILPTATFKFIICPLVRALVSAIENRIVRPTDFKLTIQSFKGHWFNSLLIATEEIPDVFTSTKVSGCSMLFLSVCPGFLSLVIIT